MNRVLIYLHRLIGYLPIAWSISCISLISIASIKLGHLPRYGVDPDPTAMGYEYFEFFSTILVLLGFAAVVVWPIMLVVLLLSVKQYSPELFDIIIFIAGIVSFFTLKFVFTPQFLWFND